MHGRLRPHATVEQLRLALTRPALNGTSLLEFLTIDDPLSPVFTDRGYTDDHARFALQLRVSKALSQNGYDLF